MPGVEDGQYPESEADDNRGRCTDNGDEDNYVLAQMRHLASVNEGLGRISLKAKTIWVKILH